MRKRIFCIFAVSVLLFAAMSADALATGGQAGGGLQEHRTGHIAEHRMAEGAGDAPCSHRHTGDCYRLIEECIHEHTAGCQLGGVADWIGTIGRMPAGCRHVCGLDTGCVRQVLDCQHMHDSGCGYAAAADAAVPAAYAQHNGKQSNRAIGREGERDGRYRKAVGRPGGGRVQRLRYPGDMQPGDRI
ncbi:MAG: hypothetical protein NC489_33555 [Ruminococcus flavefaciens]|nr:hypothetical protein [Ruminococcus flavefaciens]